MSPKRVSNKKKRRDARASAGRAPPTTNSTGGAKTYGRLLVKGEELSVEELQKWICGGKIDYIRLAKRMPNAAQELKEGTCCSPDALARVLSLVRFVSYSGAAEDKGGGFLGTDEMCPFLAATGWPVDMEGVSLSDQEAEMMSEFSNESEDCTARPAMSLCDEMGEQVATKDFIKNGFEYFRRSYKETCRTWEKRLDHFYFNGRRGSFLRQCPLYGLSVEGWNEVMRFTSEVGSENRKEAELEEERVWRDTRLAAETISTGRNEIHKTCWKCGKVTSKIIVCKNCSVARCCGKEWQHNAWYDGHKRTCKECRDSFASFEKSLTLLMHHTRPTLLMEST